MSFTRKWLPAVAIHRLGVVEIAPSTHHCFRTAHPCAQSVKSWEASSSICVKVVVELQILESGRAHFYCGPCQSAKMNQLMSHVQKGEQLPIKIVDEPTQYGYGGAAGSYQPHTETLKMRVKPSPFSGPPHLKQLYGKCFTMTDDSYKYEFCPFFNVTQHEQSLRWNPYSGVLGVWQDWEIEKNTFSAMILREGDTCGDRFRTVRIILECGNTTTITNVTEPHTCDYQLVFHTPLVCHPHALLVYPCLNSSLQEGWDLIEGRLLNGELTKQGYEKSLKALFVAAGLHMSQTKKDKEKRELVAKEEQVDELQTGDFLTLDKCSQSYKALQKKMESLKTLLAVHQIPDTGDAGG